MGGYAVRVKEKNASRHKLVARDRLTRLWIHAISFNEIDKAEEHAQWLLDNNKDALVSAQAVTFGDGKIVRAIEQEAAGTS